MSRFFDGIALGIFISTSISLITLYAVDGLQNERRNAALALLTTSATIAAGYMAIAATQRSIRAQLESFEEARTHKLEAAKALLPLVLSRIVEGGRDHIQGLINGPVKAPEKLESAELSTLKECIEASSGETRKILQEILLAYQICLSRHSEIADLPPIMLNTEEYEVRLVFRRIIDWCALLGLAETLFDFARGRARLPIRTDAMRYAQSRILYLEDKQSGVLLCSLAALEDQYMAVEQLTGLSFAEVDWLKRP